MVKKGHRSIDCFLKKNEVTPKNNSGRRNSGNFNDSYHNCGKRCHKKYHCWELAKNLYSSPTKQKGTAESKNMATNNQAGQSHAEFMLTTIQMNIFLDITKLMLDPNIIITNTGETCDITPHKTCFFNLKDAKEEDSTQ